MLLFALVLGGCGHAARLSRSQYARQADAICTRYEHSVRALGNPTTLPALARYATRAAPLLRHALAQVRALRPPSSEARTAEAWLAASDTVERDLERVRDAAGRGDAAAVQAGVQRGGADDRRGAQLARQLELTICGKTV